MECDNRFITFFVTPIITIIFAVMWGNKRLPTYNYVFVGEARDFVWIGLINYIICLDRVGT